MSIVTWEQVSEQIELLPASDKLRLFKKLEADIRPQVVVAEDDEYDDFAAMARDPEIIREMRAIQEEFACADADGLHITDGGA